MVSAKWLCPECPRAATPVTGPAVHLRRRYDDRIPAGKGFVMSARDEHWCPVCARPVESVTTVMELTAEQMPGSDRPPTAIPDGAGYDFSLQPCGHPVTLLQLRRAGIEAERFEH